MKEGLLFLLDLGQTLHPTYPAIDLGQGMQSTPSGSGTPGGKEKGEDEGW